MSALASKGKSMAPSLNTSLTRLDDCRVESADQIVYTNRGIPGDPWGPGVAEGFSQKQAHGDRHAWPSGPPSLGAAQPDMERVDPRSGDAQAAREHASQYGPVHLGAGHVRLVGPSSQPLHRHSPSLQVANLSEPPLPGGPMREMDESEEPPLLTVPLQRKIWSLLNDDILPTPPPSALAKSSPRTERQALDLVRSLLLTPRGTALAQGAADFAAAAKAREAAAAAAKAADDAATSNQNSQLPAISAGPQSWGPQGTSQGASLGTDALLPAPASANPFLLPPFPYTQSPGEEVQPPTPGSAPALGSTLATCEYPASQSQQQRVPGSGAGFPGPATRLGTRGPPLDVSRLSDEQLVELLNSIMTLQNIGQQGPQGTQGGCTASLLQPLPAPSPNPRAAPDSQLVGFLHNLITLLSAQQGKDAGAAAAAVTASAMAMQSGSMSTSPAAPSTPEGQAAVEHLTALLSALAPSLTPMASKLAQRESSIHVPRGNADSSYQGSHGVPALEAAPAGQAYSPYQPYPPQEEEISSGPGLKHQGQVGQASFGLEGPASAPSGGMVYHMAQRQAPAARSAQAPGQSSWDASSLNKLVPQTDITLSELKSIQQEQHRGAKAPAVWGSEFRGPVNQPSADQQPAPCPEAGLRPMVKIEPGILGAPAALASSGMGGKRNTGTPAVPPEAAKGEYKQRPHLEIGEAQMEEPAVKHADGETKSPHDPTLGPKLSPPTSAAVEQLLASALSQPGDPLDDGYYWRKYGQKKAKGATYPRAYYRCAVPGCRAHKTVEKTSDGGSTEVVYKDEHNHAQNVQPWKRSGSGPSQWRSSQKIIITEDMSAFCHSAPSTPAAGLLSPQAGAGAGSVGPKPTILESTPEAVSLPASPASGAVPAPVRIPSRFSQQQQDGTPGAFSLPVGAVAAYPGHTTGQLAPDAGTGAPRHHRQGSGSSGGSHDGEVAADLDWTRGRGSWGSGLAGHMSATTAELLQQQQRLFRGGSGTFKRQLDSGSPCSPPGMGEAAEGSLWGLSEMHPSPGTGMKKARLKGMDGKVRKTVLVEVPGRDADASSLEDGYRWRKCGERGIVPSRLDASGGMQQAKRLYFRCSRDGCPVKRTVEISSEPTSPETNSTELLVLYEGEHNHAPPFVARVIHSAEGVRVLHPGQLTPMPHAPDSNVLAGSSGVPEPHQQAPAPVPSTSQTGGQSENPARGYPEMAHPPKAGALAPQPGLPGPRAGVESQGSPIHLSESSDAQAIYEWLRAVVEK